MCVSERRLQRWPSEIPASRRRARRLNEMARIELQAFSVNLKSLTQGCCCSFSWEVPSMSRGHSIFEKISHGPGTLKAKYFAGTSVFVLRCFAVASLHQASQVDTKGLKFNGGHFIQASCPPARRLNFRGQPLQPVFDDAHLGKYLHVLRHGCCCPLPKNFSNVNFVSICTLQAACVL